MTVSSTNFNTHPELSDQQWLQDVIMIYYGWSIVEYNFWAAQASNQPGNPNNQAYWLAQIPALGRYAAFTGLVGTSPGNSTDGWFYNLPPWTLLVIIPSIAITAAGLLWAAWGKGLLQSAGKATGGGNGYFS